MSDWLKVKAPEEKTGTLTPGKTAVLYCCPRDYWKNQSKVWRGDIGSLNMETGTIPVWRSVIGRHSPFDGMTFEGILKDYEICFSEVSSLEGWLTAELAEGKEAEIPIAGQSAALCLLPHDRTKAWAIDIGSLDSGYESEEAKEADTLFWESAFGLQSGFDGVAFEEILKDYDVSFVEVPPLEAGRFPSPLGISHEQRETNYRAHINQVLDELQ
ncbi:MAG: hypothetical protein IJK52_08765 [Oscillospiraceae bacterium]|nr:hypothetical protein [Oscillospiraceae bacterium]